MRAVGLALIVTATAAVAPAAAGPRFSLATIPVGSGPERLLVAPDLGYLFVAVADQDQVVAIRLADDTVAARMDTGMRPRLLALDPGRRRLLVVGPQRLEAFSCPPPGGPAEFPLAASAPLEGVRWPIAAEWDAAHDRLLLTDQWLHRLLTVDGDSLALAESPAVAEVSQQILIGPRLILPSGRMSVVTELDAQDFSEQRVFRGVGRSNSAVYSARHDRLYSVDKVQCFLGIVDFAQALDIDVPIHVMPWSVVADEVRDQVYIGYWGSSVITRVDSQTLATEHVPVPGPSRTLVLDSERALLYGADLGNARLNVLDTTDDTLVATFPTGQTPGAAALDPRSHKLYISNYDSGTLTRVSPGADPVVGGSTVVVNPEVIPADGTSTSLITVTPLDEAGDPLGPGHAVVITTTAGSLVDPMVSHPDGRYTQELSSTLLAETAIISVSVDGVPLAEHPRVSFHLDGWGDLRGLEPEWGFTSGGTTVTLTGDGFLTDIPVVPGVGGETYLEVWFGDTQAPTILSATDDEIACTTPPHAAGVVDIKLVKIVNGERRESFLRGGFTYVEDAELQLRLVEGAEPGSAQLTWSAGPAGPVRLVESSRPDFSGPLTETPGLVGPSLTTFPPHAITYYRIER